MIGFGGGSVMDTAKIASVLVGAEGDVRDHLIGGKRNLFAPGKVLPLILIPSTAGSGSEWGRGAIFKDEVSGEKGPFHNEALTVREVIIDPEIMRDLPPRITGDTGMDALCHAIETYTAINATLLSDLFASKAISLVAANLRAVFAGSGEQSGARYNMSLAAAMALGSGWLTSTTSKRGQLAHGLAYPVQEMGSPAISHGVSVSILLPHVMEFNVIDSLSKFVHIAELMGVPIEGMALRDAAMQSVTAVRQLSVDVGIPQRMRDVGIRESDISRMAEDVMTKRAQHAEYNCRRATREDVIRIFESAY
jgi:alcohol dehydrogenase